MLNIIKQKPNRKILGRIRFYLRLYNLSSEKRIIKHRKKQENTSFRKETKNTTEEITSSVAATSNTATPGSELSPASSSVKTINSPQ